MPSRDTPPVNYALTKDGVGIAYSMAGDGPPLVYVRGLNSHAQRDWEDPWRRRYLRALTHAFTVIVFDARGNGLSDATESVTLDGLVDDLRAVAGDLELDHFVVHGQGFGSPIAIAFAAREPERVDQLILYCGYARGADLYIPDYFMQMLREDPVAATHILGHATYPDAFNLPRKVLTLEGLSTTPETAYLFFDLARTVDVSADVASVSAPTLIMQPKGNQTIGVEPGEELAKMISGAQYIEVTSRSYNPWAQDAIEPSLTAISEFVGRPIPLMPAPRPMAVLVTDLIESTEMTHRLGEERARELFRDHDAIVRTARRRHGGHEVKHTGDGIMVRFEDPASAVACAKTIQDLLVDHNESVSDDPLNVRIGISYGDVVEEFDGLFGTTVVQAVRIMSKAAGGQVLVSESVREALGDKVGFGPARSLELKGFPKPVDAYEVL